MPQQNVHIHVRMTTDQYEQLKALRNTSGEAAASTHVRLALVDLLRQGATPDTSALLEDRGPGEIVDRVISLPKPMREQLAQQAQLTGMTLATQVRLALATYLRKATAASAATAP